MDSSLKKARDLVGHLEDQRQSWDDLNKLVTKYVIPRKGRFDKGQGTANWAKRPSGVIMDAKATRAMRVLAAGMQGGLTPPSNRWFRLGLVDRDVMEFGPVRTWLDEVENRIYWVLHKSNFYPSMHSVYTELGGFGSGCLYSEHHWQNHLNFRVLTNGEFSWGCDMYGKIDTNARRFYMTAKSLAERFGEQRLSDKTRRTLAKNPYEFVEVVHLIKPRRFVNPERRDRLNMPFASIWYEEEGTQGVLHEGGYKTFPIMATRWDVTADEVYGRSPAHDALPDVKMLQEAVRQQLMAIQKLVNPPMRVPNQYKKRLSHIPGGQTEVSTNNPEAVAPLYQIQPDLRGISGKIEDLRTAINEGFFNDLFQMFILQDRSNVTATEILEKQQEKMLILGPVIERQQSESLGPAIQRAFHALMDKGLIPPAPEEISGLEMEIEYVSTLATAQKMSQGQSLLTMLTLVGQAAEASPEVVDKIDWDQVVDEYARMTGAPAKIIRSDDQVKELRAQRAKAMQAEQQQAAALEMMKSAPAGAQQLSETYVQGQPALDRLMQQVQ